MTRETNTEKTKSKIPVNTAENKNLWIQAYQDLWPIAKKSFCLSFFLGLADSLLPFMNLYFLSMILNLLAAAEFELLWQRIVVYLSIYLVVQLLAALIRPLEQNEYTKVSRKIQALPNEKMLRVNFHYSDNKLIHDKVHRINRDYFNSPASMYDLYLRTREVIKRIISLVFAIVLLLPIFNLAPVTVPGLEWSRSHWLDLGVLGIITIVITLSLITVKKLTKRISSDQEDLYIWNAIYYVLYVNLQDVEGGKEVRLYNLHESLKKNFAKSMESLNNVYENQLKTISVKDVINIIGSQCTNIVMFLLIGIRVISGALPVGMIVQLNGAVKQLMTAIENIIEFASIFTQPDAISRFYEIMDLPDQDAKGSIPVEKRLDNKYNLAVENLNFTYPDTDKQVLKNISVGFEVGKSYAIVGENGSGKTTFIKLLMRLYEPNSGEVKLNNIAANKYSLSEYYTLFSVVFQDFRLLGLTLGENIAVAPKYDETKVMEVMKQADMGSFLCKIDEKLDIYLGTEFDRTGVNISGGESQKLAIARALYKDAPIMILDEPTAALDPVAEFEVYQNFKEIVKDKTAFYISHRLSSCRFCDEILVFDNGEIVQRGKHEDLVEVPGKYKELWDAQAQYYV